MMIMERVVEAARPLLQGKTLRELVVGVSLTACCLSDGAVGVSYVLRDRLPNGCSVFPYAQEAEGRPAQEIAAWAVTGRDDLQRGIGAAVLDAASQSLSVPDDDFPTPFGLELRRDDVVGMVGYLPPIARRLGAQTKELFIFDRGAWLEGDPDVQAPERQGELLPSCDILILTGTTTVNGTIDGLLAQAERAREIVLVGTSTPMVPAGFAGSGVTRLAGAWWRNEAKDILFKKISLAGGIRSVSPYMIHKLALV